MASGSNKTIEFYSNSIPLLNDSLEYASMGIIPEGMYNNLEYLKDIFRCDSSVTQEMQDVLLDPQNFWWSSFINARKRCFRVYIKNGT